ncbi:MAG: translation elongation factor 4 [Phycisphaerales bacterium]|nr:translation elongation factor 4 [Phycisphaerales bacterium]
MTIASTQVDPSAPLGSERNPILRNFSIIAHIDHGKSTLADRLLQSTHAVSDREAKQQLLDSMDLERERGITIKASAVTVRHVHEGKHYMLNFIDTPGHVDFSYEVSRALTACEGAVLVVDSTQGVEAQTLANAYLAVENDLEIITVVNKIDLPAAQPEEVAMEIEQILGFAAEDAIFCSAKTGEGIMELLGAICEKLPPPRDAELKNCRSLIFDSHYDDYRGVIIYVRQFDGRVAMGDRIRMMGTGRTWYVTELGKYTPKPLKVDSIGPGETGYLIASIKTLADVRVGDTITQDVDPAPRPLPGYEEPRQMVFCDFYPATSAEAGKGADFEELREAMTKLSLNDASFTFQPVHSEALGFGFRCGFLGLLHMDIIQERLEREGGVEVIQTAPTVTYMLKTRTGEEIEIHNPADLPDAANWLELKEPIVRVEIIVPSEFVGDVMSLCLNRRGLFKTQQALSDVRQMLTWELPLAEIIYDFFDKLKGMTRGYATMDYEIIGFKPENLVKVDILINGDPVEALSFISHRETADKRGRSLLNRLKKEIDRHQFEIPLQAVIGGKIIARETIKSVRKNVTAKCYGGDVTRKRKLLEKQKRGKKRMKSVGSVDIPQEAFMAVLDAGE